MSDQHPVARWLQLADTMATFFEVAFLAFNLHGLRTPLGRRVRMEVTSLGVPRTEHLMVVPSGCADSPFRLADGYLEAGGYPVAGVGRVYGDDVVPRYLRCFDGGRWRAATINSKTRSRHTGRPFCPTNPETPVDPRLGVVDGLNKLLDGLAAELGDARALTDLDEITVSTDHFQTETAALQQLRTVRQVLNDRGLSKTRIGFQSSVLQTPKAFAQIAAEVAPFLLVLTAECATRRDVLSKPSTASLSPHQMPGVLAAARASGVDTSFTYMAGLDPLHVMADFLAGLMPHVTVFPSIQVVRTPLTHQLRAPGADDLDYYLRARRRIERITPDGLVPERWRCYRSLWYGQFRGRPLSGPTR